MTSKLKHILLTFLAFFLTAITSSACTCIGKDKQTTENELSFADIAVKGKVISVTDYTYYDTAAYFLSGMKLNLNQSSYLVRKYKLYKLTIHKKFKSSTNMPDTISIITWAGDGDCGYEFEVGKDYIIYGETWKEKSIVIK